MPAPRIADVGKFIVESARHFHLVDEVPNAAVTRRRSEVQSIIAKSHRLMVVGFHFDETDVKAIGLESLRDRSKMFCLNYAGHRGVGQRVEALRVPLTNIRYGSSGAPMHIDTAIDEGFFEQ